MDELELIAEQYDVDLEDLKKEKGELSLKVLEDFIKEQFYPRVREEKKLSGVRKVTAQRLSESHKNAPHVTLNMEIVADNLFRLREEAKKKVSLTVIMIKLLSQALKDFPRINATFDGEKITYYDSININVAIDAEYGLITPVIRDVDKKSIEELAAEYEDLVNRAKSNSLKEKDFVGGTFTITNLGMFDIDFFTPIINPPQIAILGVNRIKKSIIFEGDEQKVARTMFLSLTFDHRAIDGAPAARFLQEVKKQFEGYL